VIRPLLRFRFVRDAGALTVSQVLVSLLTLVQGVLVARWLGPEGFGVAALVMSYPGLVFGFFDARSNVATVKYVSEFSAAGERERVRAMCKLSLVIDVAIALLTLAVVFATGRWAEAHIIHRSDVTPLMLLYAAAFVPRAVSVPCRAVLEVLGSFRTVAWIEVAARTLGVGLVLGLVLAGFGVAGVVAGNALALAVSGVGISLAAWPRIRRTWGPGWLRTPLRTLRGRGREILRFLMYTELTELVNLVSKQADLVILGYFTGPQEAGYFRLAKRLVGLVDVVVGPLQSVLYPRLAAQWGADRREELVRTLRRYAGWVAAPLALGVLLLLPVTPLAVRLAAGAEFLPAALPAQLLAVDAALWLAVSWVRPFLHAVGAVRFLLVAAALANATCLVGFLVAAPRFGAAGMAAVILVSGLLFGKGLGLVLALRHLSHLRRPRLEARELPSLVRPGSR
jgi:O-antigen/teichoic acid export membrane protein